MFFKSKKQERESEREGSFDVPSHADGTERDFLSCYLKITVAFTL